MKTAVAVIVLVVMPLGFFVLAAMIVNRMLAKRRQQCPDRSQRSSASTQDDGTSHPSALLHCGLELERAAAQPTS
jgi:cytochrome c-type biogenesis protein CcmH/NrfF